MVILNISSLVKDTDTFHTVATTTKQLKKKKQRTLFPTDQDQSPRPLNHSHKNQSTDSSLWWVNSV